MKKSKRFLSLALSLLMMLGTVLPCFGEIGSVFTVKAQAADPRLKVNADGSFKILQLADIQDGMYLSAKILATVRLAIRRTQPDLIVLTGDNVKTIKDKKDWQTLDGLHNGYAMDPDDVKATIDVIVDEFIGANGEPIPFAVTYGNHDTEYNGVTLKLIDDYFHKKGALTLKKNISTGTLKEEAADDNSSVTYGTGYLDVYDAAGTNVVKRVILLNSGTYAPSTEFNGSGTAYGKAGYYSYSKSENTAINATYGERNYRNIVSAVNEWTSDPSVQCIAYEHISLQQIYLGDCDTTRILKKDANGVSGNGLKVDNGAISGSYRISTANATVSGDYYEYSGCSYGDTWELYKALAKPNVAGLFYGHDHLDTVSGVTTITENGTAYTLRQGFGGGLMVYGDYAAVQCVPRLSTYTLTGNNGIVKDTYDYIDLSTGGAVYPSDGSVKYIGNVAMFYGTSFAQAMTAARKAGYTPVTRFYNQGVYYADMNQYADDRVNDGTFLIKGTDGDSLVPDADGRQTPFICIAYKTTDDPSRAVRDLRVDYEAPSNIRKYVIGKNTVTYTKLIEAIAHTTADANHGIDVRDSSGSVHKYVSVYTTTDPHAGAPIVELIPIFRNNGNVYKQRDFRGLQICDLAETFPENTGNKRLQLADFNDGLHCDNYLYIFQKRYDGVSALYAEPDIDDVITSVPETVYLKPEPGATDFWRYVNRPVDENGNKTADTNANAETGKIWFYCPNAVSVTVKAKSGEAPADGDVDRGKDVHAATLTSVMYDGDETNKADTAVGMTPVPGKPGLYCLSVTNGSVNAVAAGSFAQIKWVFGYTTASGAKRTQISYSTLYAPLSEEDRGAAEAGSSVDKSELRSLVDTVIQSVVLNGENASFYNDDNGDATSSTPLVMSAVRYACYCLGKVNATASEIEDAFQLLFGYYGTSHQFRREYISESTVTVQYRSGNTVIRTEKAAVPNGSVVFAFARENEAYRYTGAIEDAVVRKQITGDCTIVFDDFAPKKDEEGPKDQDDKEEENTACPYCGKTEHKNLLDRVVCFFRRIIYYLKSIPSRLFRL